ncbi:hypothetical protein DFH08DRAFT_942608 [Mycena albidolilacea]|uniref:Uncharacterized protein n=1 Tax=Mycena albidolilacea TaxID=1033008 RepID=A0AAD7EEL4_9AGAR|nr:hypothetical protein DFH08DRAFT_942608 [Mycena albidolilacea]
MRAFIAGTELGAKVGSMAGKGNLNGLEVWEIDRRNWVPSERRRKQGTKRVSSDRSRPEWVGSAQTARSCSQFGAAMGNCGPVPSQMESVSFSFNTEMEGKRMEMNLHGEVAQDFHHLVKERIIEQYRLRSRSEEAQGSVDEREGWSMDGVKTECEQMKTKGVWTYGEIAQPRSHFVKERHSMNIQSTDNIPMLVQPRQERGDQTLGFGRDTTGSIVYRHSFSSLPNATESVQYKLAGSHAIRSALTRPDIPEVTHRTQAVNPTTVKHWFDAVKQRVVDAGVPPDHQFAIDETGFWIDHGPKTQVISGGQSRRFWAILASILTTILTLILEFFFPSTSSRIVSRIVVRIAHLNSTLTATIGRRGAHNTQKRGGGSRESITFIVTIHGDGGQLIPTIIFKGVKLLKHWGRVNPLAAKSLVGGVRSLCVMGFEFSSCPFRRLCELMPKVEVLELVWASICLFNLVATGEELWPNIGLIVPRLEVVTKWEPKWYQYVRLGLTEIFCISHTICFAALAMAQIPVPGMDWDMVVLLKNNIPNANPGTVNIAYVCFNKSYSGVHWAFVDLTFRCKRWSGLTRSLAGYPLCLLREYGA